MTGDFNEAAVCNVVETALKSASSSQTLSQPVTMESTMGNPREWDSLSFVSVFMAVGESFDVDLEDDDAIYFQSTRAIFDFLDDILNEWLRFIDPSWRNLKPTRIAWRLRASVPADCRTKLLVDVSVRCKPSWEIAMLAFWEFSAQGASRPMWQCWLRSSQASVLYR